MRQKSKSLRHIKNIVASMLAICLACSAFCASAYIPSPDFPSTAVSKSATNTLPRTAPTKKIDYRTPFTLDDADEYLLSDLITENGAKKGALDLSQAQPNTLSNADLKSATSYTQLLQILENMGVIKEYDNTLAGYGATEEEEIFEDAEEAVPAEAAIVQYSPNAAAVDMPATEGGSYSTTNTQVAAVDEADIIKTDGEYIYYLNQAAIKTTKKNASGYAYTSYASAVSIVSAKEMKMKTVAVIEDVGHSNASSGSFSERFQDMYISGNKLIITAASSEALPLPAALEGRSIYNNARSYTSFYVYDIKNKSTPKLERTVRIEGNLISTRFVDNTLYFTTNIYFWSFPYSSTRLSSVLPAYQDSAIGKSTYLLSPASISYVPGSKSTSYMQIGSFNVNDEEAVDVQAILGNSNTIYMNSNALYLVQYNSENSTIYKFSVAEHKLVFAASAKVPGSIINQYAMDEYNGNFRIATTDAKQENGIYVFNEKLNRIGTVNNLAEGERIYAVRFTGNTGYMVTFKNMDPLFVIDLSNPSLPKVLGELKLPGFSEYLHPVGNGLMLGIGRETTETYIRNSAGKEIVTGFEDRGFKLSLFDVSDPAAPKELDKLVLGSNYTHSPASDNPKTIMVDANKKLLAFPITSYDYGNSANNNVDPQNIKLENGSVGLIIRITDKNKLNLDAQLSLSAGGTNSYDYNDNVYNARFAYIDKTLYIASNNTIRAYDYASYKYLASHTIIPEAQTNTTPK